MAGYIATSKRSDWETPQDLFDRLNEEFRFELDVAATKENAKCKLFFTPDDDGLTQDWGGYRVWCNPPYGRVIADWVRKAAEEDNPLTVMLLPARTDVKWFHEYCYGKAEIRFIKGRLKFGGSKTGAPFPSMLVIFKK